MRCIDRAGNLNSKINAVSTGNGLPEISCFSVRPSKQFHDNEVQAVHFINLMNRADIRMVQRRSCLRLQTKACCSTRDRPATSSGRNFSAT